MAKFCGACYDPAVDDERLTKQIGRVYECIKDGKWRTLEEIQYTIKMCTGHRDPESSISAQIRHLKKDKFGSYVVEKRRSGEAESGLFEYRLLPPNETGQLNLFN